MDGWTAYLPDRASKEDTPELYDPEIEPKTWRRASLEMKTHPLHPFPKIKQADLLLPAAADKLALLGACLICGVCISVLWVYFPVFFASVLLDRSLGGWLWGSMAVVALVTGLLLFRIALQRERGYPQKLY